MNGCVTHLNSLKETAELQRNGRERLISLDKPYKPLELNKATLDDNKQQQKRMVRKKMPNPTSGTGGGGGGDGAICGSARKEKRPKSGVCCTIRLKK